MSALSKTNAAGSGGKAPLVSHAFTLILSGASEITPELADAIFEAGCDDATLACRSGVVCLIFDREAPTLREAIGSAIRAVEGGDLGLSVVRVEPDELVTAAEVARRIGQSRESVRLYAVGKRGPGGFPPPIVGLGLHTPLYRWADVARWWEGARQQAAAPGVSRTKAGGPGGRRRTATPRAFISFNAAEDIAAVNALLGVRRVAPTPDAARALWVEFGLTRPEIPIPAEAIRPAALRGRRIKFRKR